MPVTTAGVAAMAACVAGEGPFYDATTGYMGVGDSTDAFDAADTDLQASTNKVRVAVDGAPDVTGAVVTWIATFTAGVGTFAWEEVAMFNHASAGDMLLRKVESLGTKSAGAVWVLSIAATFAKCP